MLRPKIKEYFDIFDTGNDRYQVRGAEYVSVLRGTAVRDIFKSLLPLLNGEYTTDELIEKLEGISRPEIVRALILKLGELGILEDASDKDHRELSPEQAQAYRNQMMFFGIVNRDSQESNEARFQKALLDSKLSIIGTGELASRVAAECARAGIGTVVGVNLTNEAATLKTGGSGIIESRGVAIEDAGAIEETVAAAPPSLLALALDRPEPAFLDRVNKMALDLSVPMLHSRINGTEGIVGPLVVPGKTACLKCHHLRMIRNYDFYDEYVEWEQWIEGEGKYKRSPAATIGPFTSIVAGLAALEIIKRLSGFYEPELFGKFLKINALTLEIIPHKVLRIPRCPSCGKLRDKAVFTPWVKDERTSSQERISFGPSSDVGKNGGGR